MKIVILGDTHFGGGYSLGKIDSQKQVNSRLLDHAKTMEYVIDYCADNDITSFIITGDVFEHRRPESAQITIFSELLAKLSDLSIHTHIVIGNHDIIRARNATTVDMLEKLKLPYVHIWSEIDTFHIESMDESDGLNVIFLPYRTRQMLKCDSNEEAIFFLKSRLIFERQSIRNKDKTIVVGHFALQSAKMNGAIIDINSVPEIILPIDTFDNVESVIMGHIHQHQVLSKTPFITHIGSMEKTDFGESDENKYFLVIDTSPKEHLYEFYLLPNRRIFDIKIDQSESLPDSNVMNKIQKYIKAYSLKNNLVDSIVKVEIILNENIVSEINSSKIIKLLHELGVYNCVGVYSSIVSKRQLRSSEITEKLSPRASFEKWLEFEDEDIRDELKRAGNKIIDEIGGKK